MKKDYQELRASTFSLLKNHPPLDDRDFSFPVENEKTRQTGLVFKKDNSTYTIVESFDKDSEFIRVLDIKNRKILFNGELSALIKEGWITL